MNISGSSTGAARYTPPPPKIEEKETPDRITDNDARDKAAAAASIKAAQANQPVSAVPRAPLSENAGKLVDKLV
jgi:hypothetical protein